MTFEEMIEQAMAMLRRHKHVTYRALRRQFDLDETYLADLKDAILYAYPQVVEDDGRGLVWTEAAPRGEGSGLRLAQHADDPALAVVAHQALGNTWLCLGALPAARALLEEGIARHTPDQRRDPVFRMGQDPGVVCRALAAWILWLLGCPDQALTRLHEALVLAHDLLAGVYAWFTEGLDTADFQDAKALLEALGA